MRRDPRDESIYTLQRRLGMQRRVPDAPPEPTDTRPAFAVNGQQQRNTSKLGRLFSWRLRVA
jgi:hypothetical protein